VGEGRPHHCGFWVTDEPGGAGKTLLRAGRCPFYEDTLLKTVPLSLHATNHLANAVCVRGGTAAFAGVPLPFICRKRAAKSFVVSYPDERSEIRERHKSSLIVPGHRSAHPGYKMRAVSTSLFDITPRAQIRAARTGLLFFIFSRVRGEVE